MATETLPRFAGHSDDQVASILSEIAKCASILVEQLRDGVADCADSEIAVHAAIVVAQKIGLLADAATDQPLVGGYQEWMLGGNFRELGTMAKGVDHA